MNYGYARVSTKEQNESRQIIAFEKSCLKLDKIYLDKQSGKDFERAEYKKMIKRLKEGDIIVIKSIDRLGRNYSEIIAQWQNIVKVKKADIIVLDMPILDTTKSKDLIGTLISDLVLQLLSYVAENERKTIKQRQAEGIAAAKARGVKFGRSRIYNSMDYMDIYKRIKNGEIKVKDGIRDMGVSEKTYRRIKRELEEILHTETLS